MFIVLFKLRTFLTICLIAFASSPENSGAAGFAAALEGKLVARDSETGELRPHRVADHPGTRDAEYFAIYFSAHWCAPCRKTTPALVGFYNEQKAAHPEFEFIFVSEDRDQDRMARYMEWAEMPWPALAWDQRSAIPQIAEFNPSGIPFLALLDKDGNLLGASEHGGFNVGIQVIMTGLQERLGIGPYDVQERHGESSPFVVAAYVVAAVLFVIAVIRRLRRRGDEA